MSDFDVLRRVRTLASYAAMQDRCKKRIIDAYKGTTVDLAAARAINAIELQAYIEAHR